MLQKKEGIKSHTPSMHLRFLPRGVRRITKVIPEQKTRWKLGLNYGPPPEQDVMKFLEQEIELSKLPKKSDFTGIP